MNPAGHATGEGLPSAAQIAEAVAEHGQCTVEIDPLPTQRLVDLHWVAHQAGRLLGVKIRVIVKHSAFGPSNDATVTIVPRRGEDRRRVTG